VFNLLAIFIFFQFPLFVHPENENTKPNVSRQRSIQFRCKKAKPGIFNSQRHREAIPANSVFGKCWNCTRSVVLTKKV